MSAAAVSPEAMPSVKSPEPKQVPINEELRRIPLDQLHDSPLNPRKRFDPASIGELQDNLLQTGQLTPMIVRPMKGGKGFELAAGHRRRRACLMALEKHPEGARFRRLDQPLCVVREMDDKTFIETLNIENLQRSDLRPLEEARGFAELQKVCGYDVEKLAHRTGKSERFVYDRLTLLKLVPEGIDLLEAEIISAAHAIEIARETPEDQRKIIGKKDTRSYGGERYTGGLFEFDHGEPELGLKDRRKPRSIRELRTWINDHIRHEPELVDPVLFPESAQVLTEATKEETKIVHITRDFTLKDDAKDDKTKTYGNQSWKRADGLAKSKTCEYSVVGLIVAGPGRDEAFRVCVNKDKCKIHWPQHARRAEQRKQAAKKAAKAPTTGGNPGAQAKQLALAEAAKRKEADLEAAIKLEADRWEKAEPAILEAIAAVIRKAPAGGSSVIGKMLIQQSQSVSSKAAKLVPIGKNGDDLVRHLAFGEIQGEVEYQDARYLQETAADFGVNWKKIQDEVAPPPKAEKKSADVRKTEQKAKKGKAKKAK